MITKVIFLLLGTLAGAMGALVGLGGGIVLIPALTGLMGFDQKLAQGTTLTAFLPPVTILSVINYYKAGSVNMIAAILLCIGLFIGGYFGSKLALSIPNNSLAKVFGIVMLLVGLRMLFK